MEDKDKGDGGQGGSQSADLEALRGELDTLKTNQENLTKGIASYRDETQRAKAEASQARQELEKFKKDSAKKSDDNDEVQLDPEDEKKLDAFLKRKGVVTGEELQAERTRIAAESMKSTEATAIDSFVKDHPDADTDENWAKIQAEFKSWYRQPQSLSEYKQVLEKIYKDVVGSKEDAVAKAKAQEKARQRLSLGGGSQSGDKSSDQIEELQKRYPNLSREQIEEQLASIDALYQK